MNYTREPSTRPRHPDAHCYMQKTFYQAANSIPYSVNMKIIVCEEVVLQVIISQHNCLRQCTAVPVGKIFWPSLRTGLPDGRLPPITASMTFLAILECVRTVTSFFWWWCPLTVNHHFYTFSRNNIVFPALLICFDSITSRTLTAASWHQLYSTSMSLLHRGD